MGPSKMWPRLIGIAVCLTPSFLLLSQSYEVLFYILLIVVLGVWIKLEAAIQPSPWHLLRRSYFFVSFFSYYLFIYSNLRILNWMVYLFKIYCFFIAFYDIPSLIRWNNRFEQNELFNFFFFLNVIFNLIDSCSWRCCPSSARATWPVSTASIPAVFERSSPPFHRTPWVPCSSGRSLSPSSPSPQLYGPSPSKIRLLFLSLSISLVILIS